jgi:hypothetical protein
VFLLDPKKPIQQRTQNEPTITIHKTLFAETDRTYKGVSQTLTTSPDILPNPARQKTVTGVKGNFQRCLLTND